MMHLQAARIWSRYRVSQVLFTNPARCYVSRKQDSGSYSVRVGFFERLKRKFSNEKIIGMDHLGNVYYEKITRSGKTIRTFQNDKFNNAEDVTDFIDDVDIPVEWQGWLRKTRDDPPTQEEININLAIAATKKIKGRQLEEKYNQEHAGSSVKSQSSKKKVAFPSYDEYEIKAVSGARQCIKL
ncbi:NADH dehydrogenase [ubiquinone] 1 alpha subcomplex assembly factor 2 isoform X2 [Lingula anatina]|uniref:NADH dehydrogenase [ubiquinone] 1 alpha subcomplex assembly factor 2 isoform X2 n=1 Tax=Lingula anatina TaxID=7574 RepID=A0A1S3IGR4_LINAN|nr:NADH dehydrogenase [ubiquinone] 1 alpha subcomplex assembly factor 2 isoform X2 [Lingula anatina]|eukprot:XP_013396664.1 NADH dehydrogenase [ubiquinone] 1 alpha subcomplex assembly factor 2 isoform X2 [Lingula anatina]